jgi:5-methyltetrahydrofolate--homocysteine methyltransferase
MDGPALPSARAPGPGRVRRALEDQLERRILVLDGAMATMIQRRGLDEAAVRGRRFRSHPLRLQANHDLLVLTRPDIIAEVHDAYLAAGADIIASNSFSSTAIAQADYGLEELAYEMNRAAAALAAEAVHRWSRQTPHRPRFVAGAMGPTNRSLSLSPDVHDPARRATTFREMVAAYRVQVRGLLDGGADLLLLETVFDALNAKAAILAVLEAIEARGQDVPLMISVTLGDRSGRTLAGQTLEAFCISVAHGRPFSLGLNCGRGAREMRGHLAELARLAPGWVSCHPNAGLPNAFGEYDEQAGETAALLRDAAASGLVNILGGCCGTTPAHTAAIARAADGLPPRPRPGPPAPGVTRLAGLDPLVLGPEPLLLTVGERTNVTGSRRFARLVVAGQYADAAALALEQVRGGAHLLDVNVDEGMLDAVTAMRTFLHLIGSDPEIARVPLMIDSSRWAVVEAGLECVQGKPIVNSISLKDGEAEFLRRARHVRAHGAACVVMAFDEQGQADTRDRRVEICRRAYDLLVGDGYDPSDIVFDPNILAVATGLSEYARGAIDVLEAIRLIKAACPGARIAGGVSDLSFAFRGHEVVREAMHAIFLEHAAAAGLDLAMVNAGRLPVPDGISPELRAAVEDVLFDRRPDAIDRLGRLR